jgi:hypothetical protein
MDNLTAGNPVAHRVRVYYTGSDTLYEGEPLCYSFKTTRNWYGGSVNDAGEVTASEYVAEGSHNASKYMCVESPFRASITSMDSVAGSNVITGDGTDFANFHVGMAVSIASASDANADGNYVITAVGALGVTITLDMTAAEAAAVTTQADVTVQIDNISSFAGVVARGGWVGKSGPRVIDIYVPNGAVVPVRNDQNCVLGKTILAVHTNEQHLTAPAQNYALPVAIAWETVDTATTTGLVLAKLDTRIFVNQTGDNGALEVDDEDSGAATVNKIIVKFLQGSGNCTSLWVEAQAGDGSSPESYDYGLAAYFQSTYKDGSTIRSCSTVGVWMNIDSGADAGATSGHISAIQAGIYEAGDDPWTTGDRVNLSVLQLTLQIEDDPDANCLNYIRMRNDGGHAIDGIFSFANNAGCGLATAASKNSTHGVPFLISGTVYYFLVTNTIA